MLKKIMQKANAKKKDQKGFTLIELLAVIVILAILAAIAIPSIISIINKQNDKATVQDAITVIHAAKLFVADHNVQTGTSVTINREDATIGSGTGAKTFTEGWGQYVNKTSGTVPNYVVTFDGTTTYSINSSDLQDIVGASSDDVNESELIDYNK